MKQIISIVEAGQWSKHPQIAKMTIEQIENMRQTILEFEELGIRKTLLKQSTN